MAIHSRPIVAILLFLFSHNIYACVCSTVPLLDRVANSQFVATAKILNVYADESDNDYHHVDIELLNLYKGEPLKSLRIRSVLNSSCAFMVKANTTWLIFATEYKAGQLSFGSCSGSVQIDEKIDPIKEPVWSKNHARSINRKLQTLEYLKKNNINPINEFRFFQGYRKTLKFRGYKVKNEPFSLYELSVNTDYSLADVKVLKGFDNAKLDKKVSKHIKENIYLARQSKNRFIPHSTKIIIAVFYYEAEGKHKSFVSGFD